MVKIVESAKFSLNKCDWRKWFNNFLVFGVIPVLIVYLYEVSVRITTSGLSLQCFIPNMVLLGAMVVALISSIINLLKKYIQC
jgi:hypothetical protein